MLYTIISVHDSGPLRFEKSVITSSLRFVIIIIISHGQALYNKDDWVRKEKETKKKGKKLTIQEVPTRCSHGECCIIVMKYTI